jgi:uncharacterized protein YeaO (DUF488 family)
MTRAQGGLLEAEGRRSMPVQTKRAYDPPEAADGRRVLVDRVWPRGLTKERLQIDDWARDLAPSTALRKWFGHDPARWEEFARRFREELDDPPRTELLSTLQAAAAHGTLTLVYGAKDREHNQAVVLRDVIEQRPSRQ